jgi:YVTN family beta-propeller protein
MWCLIASKRAFHFKCPPQSDRRRKIFSAVYFSPQSTILYRAQGPQLPVSTGYWSEIVNIKVFFSVSAAVISLAGTAAPWAAESAPGYVVSHRWKLGGAGGWDYLTVDSTGKRLFISRGDHVDVVDTAAGTVMGVIADTQGVHGIALAENLKRGYTSNGRADSITVFDLDTLKVISQVPVSGHNPDAILYEPISKRVFTFNGRSKDVTVIDASTLAILATIPVPDKPEFAVEDGAGQIFVNIESEAGQMLVIDSRKLAVTSTWPMPGCASPSGLAIDKVKHRLFSVCDAGVMAVTDGVSGKQIATLKIGEGPDAAAFDVTRHLAFSSNGEGTLTVVQQDASGHYTVRQNVKTQRGARTMALDQGTGRIYLVTSEFVPAPAENSAQPRPRPIPVPESFTVMVVESAK